MFDTSRLIDFLFASASPDIAHYYATPQRGHVEKSHATLLMLALFLHVFFMLGGNPKPEADAISIYPTTSNVKMGRWGRRDHAPITIDIFESYTALSERTVDTTPTVQCIQHDKQVVET